MILVSNSRRYGYEEYLIPMKDENNADMFSNLNAGTWVYYLDGKRHKNVPVMVLPGLEDMFGGEKHIRSLGYRKHWNVFFDIRANKYTFGNHACYSKSSSLLERQMAERMMTVDIDVLKML